MTQNNSPGTPGFDYSEDIDGPRRNNRRWLIGGGVVAVLLAVAVAVAFLSRPADDRQSSSADGQPVSGGELVYSDAGPVTNLKFANYSVMNYYAAVTDTLLYLGDDGKTVPYLAESYTTGDDGREYTFTLREGVTFSDGSALDAEVVARNLEVLARGDDARGVPATKGFQTIEKVTATDDRTLVVHLTTADNTLLSALSSPANGIVSDSTLDLGYDDQKSVDKLVGSGAFVFESQKPGEEIVLKRRDDYSWPPSTSSNKGAAYLERVIIRNLPEVGLRASAVNSGQVDLAWGIQPSDESVVTEGGSAVDAVQSPGSVTDSLVFRASQPVVSDPRVRQALTVGTDRSALISSVLSDSYVAADSWFAHNQQGFTDLSDDLAYDPDKANRLLDEAGWTERDNEGFRVKDGQRLSFKAVSSNQRIGLKPSLEYLEGQWRRNLGVEMISYAGDQTAFNASWQDPSYQVQGNAGWPTLMFGPQQLAGSQFYEDAKLESLLTALRTATTEESYNTAAEAVQKYIVTDSALVLPLFDEVQVYARGEGVHMTYNGLTSPQFQEAWVE